MNQQVLFVTSNRNLPDVYAYSLRQQGCSVQCAFGGVDCMAKLAEGLPDIVILDDGLLWGGVEGVLELFSEVPGSDSSHVIVLGSEDFERWSQYPQVRCCLRRPVSINQLLQAVSSCDDRAQMVP